MTSAEMTPRAPAVSVIVPAHNAERTLARTLAALAGQDLSEPYEVIVVDDGSADATAVLAERAGESVRVIRQVPAAGASALTSGVPARYVSPPSNIPNATPATIFIGFTSDR